MYVIDGHIEQTHQASLETLSYHLHAVKSKQLNCDRVQASHHSGNIRRG